MSTSSEINIVKEVKEIGLVASFFTTPWAGMIAGAKAGGAAGFAVGGPMGVSILGPLGALAGLVAGFAWVGMQVEAHDD